jgi:hypothetical protein
MIKWMRMRGVGYVECMGEEKSYTILMGKPEGNRPLGRSRRRWEDDIKSDFAEMGFDVGRINLTRNRNWWRVLMNTVLIP